MKHPTRHRPPGRGTSQGYVLIWAAEMNAHFPTYSAAVNCVVLINKPVTCTVSANWNESNLAYNQTTATLAGQTAQSLTLYVQP